MTAVAYPHIEFNADGLAVISGTTMKVVELIREHLAWECDAAGLQENHSDLSLAQIYSALAYFHDHEAEVRDLIARRAEEARRLCAQAGTSPLRERLRAEKLRRAGRQP